jgi:exopolysaccharide production protein ExoY
MWLDMQEWWMNMDKRLVDQAIGGEETHSAKVTRLPLGAAPGMPAETLSVTLRSATKRAFDASAALFLLILAAPLFAVVALLASMDGGPVFFRHRRVGRGGVLFGCWKFRTMILDAEPCLEEYFLYHPNALDEWQREQKLAFDPRITPIGKFLRRSSLDELPQLLNVLVGEMSLVGPRPVTVEELRHYGKAAPLYMSARPGITGLWQVSGRNDVGYAQRVALDEQYLQRGGALLDLLILYRTIGVVFSRRGAR